jgi:hypothetical protein
VWGSTPEQNIKIVGVEPHRPSRFATRQNRIFSNPSNALTQNRPAKFDDFFRRVFSGRIMRPMTLLAIILRILFPHDPVRRIIEHTRDLLARLVHAITDERWIEWLTTNPDHPDTIARFETWIDDLEAGIDLVIYLRARQLLGLPVLKWTKPRINLFQRRRSRSFDELLWRVELAAYRFSQIERLARLRAPRLKRLLEADPLGIAPDHPIEAEPCALVCAQFEAACAPAHPLAPSRAGMRVRAPPWPQLLPETGNSRLEAQLPRSQAFAYSARKSPLAPPDFAMSRTPSIRMPRSTALSMS